MTPTPEQVAAWAREAGLDVMACDDDLHIASTEDLARFAAIVDAHRAEQIKQSSDNAATVDVGYKWRPVDEHTPRGTKIQLINKHDGVAQYGHYIGPGHHWTHWAPLPTF